MYTPSPFVMGISPGNMPHGPFPIGVTPEGVALIRASLPSWANGVSIPHTFVFKPSGTPGVALAPALAEDPNTGAVAMPIYQRPKARYPEHLHCGLWEVRAEWREYGEDAIILSGSLQDVGGRYETTAEYKQLPWSLHTPESVGDEPAIIVGIAHGGVLTTSLHKTLGADLLRENAIDRIALGHLFANVPPDSAQPAPTRKPLFEYVLQVLLAVDEAGETPLPQGFDTYWTGNGREWILRLAELEATERVAYARQWLATPRPSL